MNIDSILCLDEIIDQLLNSNVERLNKDQLCTSYLSNFSLIGMEQTRDKSDNIESLHEYFAWLWGPSTSNHVPFVAKNPNKLPLQGHVLDKKVFREPPNLYLPSACTVYPDYLFFPGGYTAPAGGIVGAYYFADRRRRRIVTYSASHVSCTELQVGTVSRKNIRRTLIITRNFSHVDLTLNFEGLNIGVSRRIRLLHTCRFSKQFIFLKRKSDQHIIFLIINDEEEINLFQQYYFM